MQGTECGQGVPRGGEVRHGGGGLRALRRRGWPGEAWPPWATSILPPRRRHDILQNIGARRPPPVDVDAVVSMRTSGDAPRPPRTPQTGEGPRAGFRDHAAAGEVRVRQRDASGADSRAAPWGVRVRRRVTCSPRRGERCTRGEHGARSSSTRASAAVATDGTQPRLRRRRAACQLAVRRRAPTTSNNSSASADRPGRGAPAGAHLTPKSRRTIAAEALDGIDRCELNFRLRSLVAVKPRAARTNW